LPEADGPQTRSSPSAELEDEALPSASGSAPQSSQVTRAGSRLHGQAEPADPILMSYSPPSRGGHCLPLGASETQAVAFLLRMETPSLEVCKRAAALLERQEQQLMEARRTIKRTDEDLQLEVTRYIRRNARRFGPQAIKVADAVRKDIQRDRKNPQRKKQRRRKERGNSAQGF
jgi:hypothetical protein